MNSEITLRCILILFYSFSLFIYTVIPSCMRADSNSSDAEIEDNPVPACIREMPTQAVCDEVQKKDAVKRSTRSKSNQFQGEIPVLLP